MKLFRRGSKPVVPAGYSVVDKQLAVSGELNTASTVRVDGRVDGARHRADTLIVGVGAVVVGDVEVRDLVVAGEILGNVIASGRVEIQAGASVTGSIRAAAMQLEEGGVVRGHLMIVAAGTEVPSIPEPRRLELTPSHSMRAVGRA
jgi:cytoskeletal protein CcmA (bactofilin family)